MIAALNDKINSDTITYCNKLDKWLWIYAYSLKENLYIILIKNVSKRQQNELDTKKDEEKLVKIRIEMEEANNELRRTNVSLEKTNQELEELTQEKDMVNEELKNANDNYKKANEQIRYTNKELENANEELKNIYDRIDYANQNLKVINQGLQETNQGLWDTNQGLWTTNEQLEKDKKSLQKKNKELKTSSAIVSHDLKSPLNVIMSYVSIIQRKYFDVMDNREKEFTNMVREKAESMINLIDDLMTYSSMNGKENNDKIMDKINIKDVIEKAEDNLKIEIEKSNPDIIKPNFMPSIYANKNQIISLFQNLIGNALKYKKKDIKPRIVIDIEDFNKNMWKLSIKDNGIGIEKEKHESIFNMYSRVHRDNSYIGHGIGLSFCKKIVNKHSGDIWVDSTPGIGSTFYFTLPKLIGETNINNRNNQTQNY